MQRRLAFYLVSVGVLFTAFYLVRDVNLKINRYTQTTEAAGIVAGNFQYLRRQLTNAAVIHPDFLKSNAGLDRDDLFYADSARIMLIFRELGANETDSVNHRTIQQLDDLLQSNLSWMLNSNVPDSITYHHAPERVAAVKKIDALIVAGLERNKIVATYHKNELNGLVRQAKILMIAFILFISILILVIGFRLLRERKKSTGFLSQLEIANQLLQNAQQIAQVGNWKYNIQEQQLYWSDEVYAIWECELPRSNVSFKFFLDSIAPDDYDEVKLQLDAAFAGTRFLDIEHKIVTTKGKIKWIHQKGKLVALANLRSGFEGTIQDITSRKSGELKLREAAIQQNLLASIIDSSEDAIISKRLDGIITSWNGGAEKIFGYKETEMIGQSITRIIPSALLKEESVIIAKIKHGLPVEPYETERLHKDGSTVNISLAVSPMLDAGGHIIGASKIARDITEKKKAELALQETKQDKEAILESIDDAFFALTKDWVVVYWNTRAEIILKKPKAETIGKSLWDIFPDSIDSNAHDQYRKVLETKQSVHFENFYAPLNQWYGVSAFPSTTGLSVYFKDVSSRKLSEIKLTELNHSLKVQAKELKQSNTELEQFAYAASHDLQEPLRMVTAFLSLLENRYKALIDEEGKSFIDFAVDGASRMRQIILDLLAYSKVGKTEDKLEEVDINAVIEEIMLLFKHAIDEKKAVVKSEALPLITSFTAPLRQVFQNLIGNALKYSKQGISPVISISCKDCGAHWQFAIKDNSIGIEQEYFDKIFVIFQRLHNKDEYSGTGMGLAVTKKIVEHMGGTIWVESVVNEGSTFYFTILKHFK